MPRLHARGAGSGEYGGHVHRTVHRRSIRGRGVAFFGFAWILPVILAGGPASAAPVRWLNPGNEIVPQAEVHRRRRW